MARRAAVIAAAIVGLSPRPAAAVGTVQLWLVEASRQSQVTVTGQSLHLLPRQPTGPRHDRVALRAEGNIVVLTWPDGRHARTSLVRLAGNAEVLRLHWDQGRQIRPLAGSVRVQAHAGRLRVVAELADEDYVAGVVNGESLVDTPWQARLAQAVVARSYRHTMGRRHPEASADACDQSHCQRWRWPASDVDLAAARATAGQIVADRSGQPLPVYYHAACGGHTAPVQIVFGGAAQPHLMGVSDQVCQTEPGWRSELSLTDSVVALRKAKHWDPSPLHHVAVTDALPTGWPVTVRLSGMRSRQIPAYQWWLAIGQHLGWGTVPGVHFDLRQEGDRLHVQGRGLGHGVGLCQRGAAAWARQGRQADWILTHYFPGSRTVRR